MDYIKHKAKDYKQALQELRSKYGEDVIVISHKYVKEGGLLNTRVFAKDVCEVTAAIHNRKSKKTEAPAPRRSGFDMKVGGDIPAGLYSMDRETQAAPRPARAAAEEPVSDLAQAMGRLNDARAFADMLGRAAGREETPVRNTRPAAAEPAERPVAAAVQPAAPADDRQFERFEKEFDDLKRTIQRLVEAGQGAQPVAAAPAAVSADEAGLEHARTILRKNEFDEDEAGHVLNEVRNSVSREDLKDKSLSRNRSRIC
jgi:flagellar biosynthesis GTPase FlhF